MRVEMEGFRRFLESHGDNLEERILAAIEDERVTQGQFNALLKSWLDQHKSTLAGPGARYSARKPATVYLSGQNSPTLQAASSERKEETGQSGIGLLVQPLTSSYLSSKTVKHFDSIGIDNGMFTQAGQRNFSWGKFKKMVKFAMAQVQAGYLDSFQFFAIPDQPMDWAATLRKFKEHAKDVQELRSIGAPAALVVQNGATVDQIPWGDIDAIFIGGDDKWKTGPEAKEITKHAQSLGKAVHMGRVNTRQRMDVASSWGVDTADGTHLMHKLGETLQDILRTNPRRPGETESAYHARAKRLLHGNHLPGEADTMPAATEPHLVHSMISNLVQNQKNGLLMQRYRAIADSGIRHRDELHELDRFLPAAPTGAHETGDDVVRFDDDGAILRHPSGDPVINQDLLSHTPAPPLAKVQDSSFISSWRRKGVLPR